MTTNDFLPFATGVGANVEDQATYAAAASTSSGLSSGLAQSAIFNKIWRQSSFMAAMLGQFMADTLSENIVDDGDVADKEAKFIAAIRSYGGEFASNTSMLFRMASAPAGWVQDTDVNDRVLRIVNTTGGGTGGQWSISGLVINGHTLTESEMPGHIHVSAGDFGGGSPVIQIHGNNYGNTNNYILQGNGQSGSTNLIYTGPAGGNEPHSHGLSADGNWRPAYLNLISATKS